MSFWKNFSTRFLKQKKCEKLKNKNKNKNKGFTLIEILIVVIIIGVLAAIAIPKYQKAILKSQLATMKVIVNSVTSAIERYYYANGKFPDTYLDLDVELPTGRYWNDNKMYESKNGITCALDDYQTACDKNRLRYGSVIFTYSRKWQIKKLCAVLYEDDPTTLRHQICREETKNTLDTCHNNWCRYYYR